MYKLTYEKRVWVVKQFLKGVSVSRVVLAQKINRSAVYQIVAKYKQFGWDGLRDHKTGRPETVLNPNAEIIILDLRKRFGYGACRIEEVLKQKGFGISHRQIEKVLIRNHCVVPNPKKSKPRKWVRYELPNPNDMWHTDWTQDPFSGRYFSAYIDDRTRLITSYGLHKRATAKNSISLLKIGIAEYGKPKCVMTDHGSQYYANRKEANQNNTQFRMFLNVLSIKHRLAPVKRPQVNGKIERFFLTYKTEYATGSFQNIKDFIKHYNQCRPHMSLHYRTPTQAWQELKNV
jgi:putative transposase